MIYVKCQKEIVSVFFNMKNPKFGFKFVFYFSPDQDDVSVQ